MLKRTTERHSKLLGSSAVTDELANLQTPKSTNTYISNNGNKQQERSGSANRETITLTNLLSQDVQIPNKC